MINYAQATYNYNFKGMGRSDSREYRSEKKSRRKYDDESSDRESRREKRRHYDEYRDRDRRRRKRRNDSYDYKKKRRRRRSSSSFDKKRDLLNEKKEKNEIEFSNLQITLDPKDGQLVRRKKKQSRFAPESERFSVPGIPVAIASDMNEVQKKLYLSILLSFELLL